MQNKNWILILVISCVTLSSCNNNPVTNTCPKQPSGTLDRANVKSITLSNTETVETGKISSDQNLGYIFEATAGKKLAWNTKENLCVWVFAPSNKLLKGNDLPEDGKYTIQIAIPKGATSFNLAMKLEDKFQPSNTIIASTPQATNTPTPSPSTKESSDLTQNKAASLVQGWLESKKRIFAPPFDRNLVNQLTTGSLYTDITKPEGSMTWLENNGSYYSYNMSRVDEVLEFNNSSSPFIKVRVTEDRTLHGKDGNIDYKESGRVTKNYTYFFVSESGTWKISDYR